MSPLSESPVPSDVVTAAIRVAEQGRRDVADVPLETIAEAAGMSRSTLLRRLGGSRGPLDDAVRAAGVDPGGQPVRVRALAAGARLISIRGPSAVTLEEVAEAANCSVPGLYSVFGSRDELFAAIYEKYSPLSDLVSICDDPATDLEQTVAQFYRTLAASLDREPRVATAMLADMFGDPSGPAARLFATHFPRVLVSIGGWLQTEVQAGRIRDIPIDVLLQQLIGPLLAHMLMRPALTAGSPNAPTLEQACSTFAAAFLRAVGAQQPTEAIPEE